MLFSKLIFLMISGSLHPSELDTGRAIFHDAATNQWPVCTTSDFVVVAGQLKHRVPSFGYVFAEKSKPGKLDSDKLMQYGVPKGLFQNLVCPHSACGRLVIMSCLCRTIVRKNKKG